MATQPKASCPHDQQSPAGSNQYQQQIVCKRCGRILLKLWHQVDHDLLDESLVRHRRQIEHLDQPRELAGVRVLQWRGKTPKRHTTAEAAVQVAVPQNSHNRPKLCQLLFAIALGVLLDYLVLQSLWRY